MEKLPYLLTVTLSIFNPICYQLLYIYAFCLHYQTVIYLDRLNSYIKENIYKYLLILTHSSNIVSEIVRSITEFDIAKLIICNINFISVFR